MINFFILIVFIAELIITFQLISFIIKCDKKVCEINSSIIKIQPVIKSSIIDVRISINKVLLSLNNLQIKMKRLKDRYKIIVIRKIITTLLFLFLNLNGRKIFAIIDLLISLNDFRKVMRKSTA